MLCGVWCGPNPAPFLGHVADGRWCNMCVMCKIWCSIYKHRIEESFVQQIKYRQSTLISGGSHVLCWDNVWINNKVSAYCTVNTHGLPGCFTGEMDTPALKMRARAALKPPWHVQNKKEERRRDRKRRERGNTRNFHMTAASEQRPSSIYLSHSYLSFFVCRCLHIVNRQQ